MRPRTGRCSRPPEPRPTDSQAAEHAHAAMTYGPHTSTDRQRMLATLGLESIDGLFDDIPAAMRASGLDLPAALDELSLARRLETLAGRNQPGLTSFLGAGAYRHHIPAAVDAVLSSGEFYTAYTPYQPEI